MITREARIFLIKRDSRKTAKIAKKSRLFSWRLSRTGKRLPVFRPCSFDILVEFKPNNAGYPILKIKYWIPMPALYLIRGSRVGYMVFLWTRINDPVQSGWIIIWLISVCTKTRIVWNRHAGESRNQVFLFNFTNWRPAFAGMTVPNGVFIQKLII